MSSDKKETKFYLTEETYKNDRKPEANELVKIVRAVEDKILKYSSNYLNVLTEQEKNLIEGYVVESRKFANGIYTEFNI
jgi:hypothetical protein